jgi:hypothetical protein
MIRTKGWFSQLFRDKDAERVEQRAVLATNGVWLRGEMHVNRIRGVVMVLAAAVAAWKGWQIHHGDRAVLASVLAGLALAMGVWELMRKDAKARPRG